MTLRDDPTPALELLCPEERDDERYDREQAEAEAARDRLTRHSDFLPEFTNLAAPVLSLLPRMGISGKTADGSPAVVTTALDASFPGRVEGHSSSGRAA